MTGFLLVPVLASRRCGASVRGGRCPGRTGLPRGRHRDAERERGAVGLAAAAHTRHGGRRGGVRGAVVDPALPGDDDRPARPGPHGPARGADRPRAARAAGAVRAAARRRASVRAGRAPGPRRGPRHGAPEAFDRLEQALLESSRLLRSTVAELHPAVLERAGLPAAVRDLVASAAARGGSPRIWTSTAGRSTAAHRRRAARTGRPASCSATWPGAPGRPRRRRSEVARRHARLTVTDDGVAVATSTSHTARRGPHRAGLARSCAWRRRAARSTSHPRPGPAPSPRWSCRYPAWTDKQRRRDERSARFAEMLEIQTITSRHPGRAARKGT